MEKESSAQFVVNVAEVTVCLQNRSARTSVMVRLVLQLLRQLSVAIELGLQLQRKKVVGVNLPRGRLREPSRKASGLRCPSRDRGGTDWCGFDIHRCGLATRNQPVSTPS